MFPLKIWSFGSIYIKIIEANNEATCVCGVISRRLGVVTGFLSPPHHLSFAGVRPSALVALKCAPT